MRGMSVVRCRDSVGRPNERSMVLDRAVACSVTAASRAALAAGLVGSLALLPVAWAQGSATRRRVPRLPAAKPPYQGSVPGTGAPIRVLAIGELTICGIGVARGDETVTAATARALARSTGRPVAWRAHGLSGATARDGLGRLLPRIAPEPADLLIVAFCVNDVTAYRSPAAFADDLVAIVTAARQPHRRCGGGHRGRRAPRLFPCTAVAAAFHPRLALGRIAGGSRSAYRAPAEARGGTISRSVRAGPVRLRRLPSQFESAPDMG